MKPSTRIFAVVWTLPDPPSIGEVFGIRNGRGEVISTWEVTDTEGGPRYWRVTADRVKDATPDWAIDWNSGD